MAVPSLHVILENPGAPPTAPAQLFVDGCGLNPEEMGSAFCTDSQYPLKSVSRGGFNFGTACFACATTCKVVCLPLTDPTPLRADGDFYARAFDGSVALPIAGYDYGGGWAPPPTGLAPAGTSTSLAAAPQPKLVRLSIAPARVGADAFVRPRAKRAPLASVPPAT